MINAIKIGRDIHSFLNEHPEIKVFKENGKIKFIYSLEEVQFISIIIQNNCIYDLEFIYKGELYHFQEEETL